MDSFFYRTLHKRQTLLFSIQFVFSTVSYHHSFHQKEKRKKEKRKEKEKKEREEGGKPRNSGFRKTRKMSRLDFDEKRERKKEFLKKSRNRVRKRKREREKEEERIRSWNEILDLDQKIVRKKG